MGTLADCMSTWVFSRNCTTKFGYFRSKQFTLYLTTVVPRYALCQAGENRSDVQGRLGCTRLVMAYWLCRLHLLRMGPCSRAWTFPSNEIGSSGLCHPNILMMMMMTLATGALCQ